MAHEYALQLSKNPSVTATHNDKDIASRAWDYADAMQAEANKREKEDAAQRRKEIREMLNAPNTFVEREGQHFDDVANQKRTPKVSRFERSDAVKEVLSRAENMGLIKPKAVDEWQPDWSQAPIGYDYWVATADHDGKISGGWFYENEPEFGESKGVSIYYSSNNNCILTDSFNYTGDWRNSLRKRPQ